MCLEIGYQYVVVDATLPSLLGQHPVGGVNLWHPPNMPICFPDREPKLFHIHPSTLWAPSFN